MKNSCNVLAYLKSGSYGHLDRAFMIMFLALHYTTLALVSFIAGKNSLLRRKPRHIFVISWYQ